MNKCKTALIFAAGLGTRLKPLTDTKPKALVKIGEKTLLQIAIEKLKTADFQRIVINAHHFAEQIFDFVQKNDFGVEILISHEKDMLLDTGGGIFYAKEKIGENAPFLVHNVDIISNADLQKLYAAHNSENLATLLVSNRNTSRYLLFNNENLLVGWQNTKTGEIKTPFQNLDVEKCNRRAFNGIHVISPKIFKLMSTCHCGTESSSAFPQSPKIQPIAASAAMTKGYKTKKMPFSITDFYLSVCHKEKIIAYQQSDLEVVDVGKIEEIKNLELKIKS